MNTKERILNYLRFLRIHSVPHIAVIPVLSALIMNERNLLSLFILFLIGIFAYIHEHVINDYVGIEIDRKVPELKNKPLITGTISKEHAIFVIIFTIIFSYALAIIFFFSNISLILLTLAALFNGIYNLYGKKFIGSDFVLAASIVFFFFFGASTVSSQFTNVLYIVASLFFIETVFVNVVEGGIKDVDHDFLGNARTLATILQVKVKDKKLYFTRPFIIFAYIFRICYFCLIIFLGFQPEINIWSSENITLLILVIILIILIAFSTYKFISLKTFDRFKIKKMYAGLTAVTLSLIFVMLYPLFGIIIVIILIVLPMTWYMFFNTILYGKALQPWV